VKFLLDENLSPAHGELLRAMGHDAVAVIEVGLAGSSDAQVAAFAVQQDRVLITLDADFANIIRFPPDRTAGVIRLRLHPPTEAAIGRRLRSAIPQLAGRNLSGRLVVVDAGRIRIR
jgi:predicted nuclease of predicted toxin-antitoxin system